MSKQRRSVSLPPEVDDYLSRDGVNASELVAKLVKHHMNGGATENQILEFRIDQVRGELEDAQNHLERKQRELEELMSRREEYEQQQQQQRQELLEEAREELAETPKHPENLGIQNWADKLDMTPEELLEKLEE